MKSRIVIALGLVQFLCLFIYASNKVDVNERLRDLEDRAGKIIAAAESNKSIALKALENSFAFENECRRKLVESMTATNSSLVRLNNKKADELFEETRKARYMVEEIILLSAEITNSLLPMAAFREGDISQMSEKAITSREKEIEACRKKLDRIKKITEELKKRWLIPFEITENAADK